MLLLNIGIKHGFSCINICQVPWEVLKTESQGTWRMLMHWKTMFDCYYCIKIATICYILHCILHYCVSPFHRCRVNAISTYYACSRAGQYTSRDGIILWPGMSILKVAQPCINSAWIALLIHGFLPVNARLLITCNSAFYAVIIFWSTNGKNFKRLCR